MCKNIHVSNHFPVCYDIHSHEGTILRRNSHQTCTFWGGKLESWTQAVPKFGWNVDSFQLTKGSLERALNHRHQWLYIRAGEKQKTGAVSSAFQCQLKYTKRVQSQKSVVRIYVQTCEGLILRSYLTIAGAVTSYGVNSSQYFTRGQLASSPNTWPPHLLTSHVNCSPHDLTRGQLIPSPHSSSLHRLLAQLLTSQLITSHVVSLPPHLTVNHLIG